MIGTSLPDYIFIRVTIGGFRLVAPLACLHVLASVCVGRRVGPAWLGAIAVLEAAFCVCVYFPRRILLQKPATHPPLTSSAERQALFERCLAEVPDYDAFALWFFTAPASALQRENAVDWLVWALFGASTPRPEWDEEIAGHVASLERLLRRQLPPGRNPAVRCMRTTLDRVDMVHRPLVWYMIVAAADAYASVALYRLGFRHFASPTWLAMFPPRPLTIFSRHAPLPASLAYWHRPHLSTTKNPVVFLQGIGIGLWPYLPFISDLVASDPDVGVLMLENLSVSMHLAPEPPDRHMIAATVARICATHGFTDVVLVAHSYGTFIGADLLRTAAAGTTTTTASAHALPHIAATVLIDPIPLLLHLPAVAHNFIYRTPVHANEWALWFFASRDADIARTLARHFFWADGVLWRDELAIAPGGQGNGTKGRKAAVVLGSADQIVDAERVRRYLTRDDEPRHRWEADGLEVLWFPGRDHGVVFDSPADRRVLVDVVRRFCEER